MTVLVVMWWLACRVPRCLATAGLRFGHAGVRIGAMLGSHSTSRFCGTSRAEGSSLSSCPVSWTPHSSSVLDAPTVRLHLRPEPTVMRRHLPVRYHSHS